VVLDLSSVIAAMLVVPASVTPMCVAILTPAIMVAIMVATITTSSLGTDNACGRENQQCSHGTTFGNSVQHVH
jgi:hypothetical protein